MKRVLVVSSIAGFLPQFLMGDVRVMQELGFEVHYASNFRHTVYPVPVQELKEAGICLHPVGIRKKPWHPIANTGALLHLIRIIRSEGIDVVHCHNPMGGMLGRLAGWLSGRRPTVIYTAHGFHFFRGAPAVNRLLYYPAEWLLARMTDVLITINREDEESGARLPLRSPCRYRIPGAGVSTERFRPMPEIRQTVREELHVPENAFHLVTAAELNDNKNHTVVLEAMHRLQDPHIFYSICGRGEGKEKLLTKIRDLHLEGQVCLLGYRRDMERVLQSADAFVFPSLREGFGMAAVEALACGIPVIASDNRGTREYMRDGENGIVCPAEDPDAFARAIRRLKDHPALAKKMSACAGATAREFSREKTEAVMRLVYGGLP